MGLHLYSNSHSQVSQPSCQLLPCYLYWLLVSWNHCILNLVGYNESILHCQHACIRCESTYEKVPVAGKLDRPVSKVKISENLAPRLILTYFKIFWRPTTVLKDLKAWRKNVVFMCTHFDFDCLLSNCSPIFCPDFRTLSAFFSIWSTLCWSICYDVINEIAIIWRMQCPVTKLT